MPPTFVYVMVLMLYLALMAASLVLSLILFLLPTKRRMALQLALATVLSLPGIFAFQFFGGIAAGTILAVVGTFYSATDPPNWIRWLIGLPTVLFAMGTFTAASIGGCYWGAHFGWAIGGGTPLRQAIFDSKELVVSWVQELRSNIWKHSRRDRVSK